LKVQPFAGGIGADERANLPGGEGGSNFLFRDGYPFAIGSDTATFAGIGCDRNARAQDRIPQVFHRVSVAGEHQNRAPIHCEILYPVDYAIPLGVQPT
jgi:hypothetical protein